MIVLKEKVEAYRIGTKLFVTDDEGILRDVKTGGIPTTEEWEAYRQYEKERFEECKKQQEEGQRMQEEYEQRLQEEEQRHEEEVAKIHFEIFGN